MNECSVAAPHESVTSESVARKARGQSGADSFVIVVGASVTPFTVVKAISGFEACAAEQVRFAGSRPRVQSQNSAPPGAKVDQLRSTRDPGMKPVAPATFVKPTDAALASGNHRDADANGAASIAKAVISPARPVVLHPVAQQAAPVVGRSVQPPKPAAAGSAQQRVKKPKSLREELLEEARRIQMSKTGGHRISKPAGSWLSRLVGRSKS
jgi:hypothetical protein